MFDKIRIWSDSSDNVHYEIRDDEDVPFVHTCMPTAEWNALRAKQIQTFPANVSVSLLADLIAVLANECASI